MKTKISALMDGELEKNEINESIKQLENNDELRETWNLYHLIGDGLRRTEIISYDFVDKFKSKLANEPVVFAPQPSTRKSLVYLSIAASVALMGLGIWFSSSLFSPAQIEIRAEKQDNKNNIMAAGMDDYLIAHQGFSGTVQGVVPYVRSISVNNLELNSATNK